MQLFWRIMIIALIAWLFSMVLLASMPDAHGQSAQPTVPVPSPTPGNGDDGVIMWHVTFLPGVMR